MAFAVMKYQSHYYMFNKHYRQSCFIYKTVKLTSYIQKRSILPGLCYTQDTDAVIF